MFPSLLMAIVHSVFISSRSSTVTLKAVVLDAVFAFTSLYLTPLFKNVVLVFAHAIVAAYLGGGNKVFTNAIYATMLLETAQTAWSNISVLLFPDDHIPPLIEDALDSSHFGAPPAAYNTLTSGLALIPSTINCLRHLNWRYELPTLLCQVAAVHVIGLGLLPFVKKVFPDKVSGSTSTTATSSSAYDITTTAAEGPAPDAEVVSHYQGTVISMATENASHDMDENNPLFVDQSNKQQPAFKMLYAPVPSSRKNKRLTAVRSNQPLWSTLASSMVLAARQESLNQADSMVDQTVAAKEVEEQEKSPTGIGICYVKFVLENVVAFYMVAFDKEKYCSFLARVNGIQWPQVSVQQEGDKGDPFAVIVYGLTPFTQYEVEIVAEDPKDKHTVSCLKINICTAVKTTTTNNQQSSSTSGPTRPLSPVTTLLDTLTTTQMNLSEEKSRLKRLRKEHAKRLTSLRSEIDAIKGKVESADKGDERNRRKVLSLRESVRQFEEEIEQLTRATEELVNKQAEVDSSFADHEQQHKTHMKVVEDKKQEESKLRGDLDRQLLELDTELTSLISKRDKLEFKRDRLQADLEKMDQPCQDEIERLMQSREKAREAKLERRKKIQDEFSTSITKMENSIEETKRKTANIWTSIQQQLSVSPSY
ncbi:hypothetical protein TRICI_006750 [Trichomonascus ciferrii]|uniref:Uncharacterized protein n=1 Tax=Trichomonascus ciferrii TaxID=44093 RepID=A0A642UGN2_9ASCO|nr:hypothetical protein TRICI_006750 [Trichomonascus ciferrii]